MKVNNKGGNMDNSEDRLVTYGEGLVGMSFNPSGNEDVNKIKQHYADIIDLLNIKRSEAVDGEVKRHYSVAITEAQTAQMWAVKAITMVR
jgi:hypothetical protein